MDRAELVEQLYSEYQGFMYHISYSMLHDRQLAEDAVHECVIRLMRARALDINSVKDSSTKSLVRITAQNVSARLYRKYIKSPFRTDTDSILEHGEENGGIFYIELKEFLSSIPHIYREIAILRIYYGYEYDAIGKLLGIRKQTAKNRMVKLRKLIHRHWIGGDVFDKQGQEKNRRGTLSIR